MLYHDWRYHVEEQCLERKLDVESQLEVMLS